jgi:hypothetical protein
MPDSACQPHERACEWRVIERKLTAERVALVPAIATGHAWRAPIDCRQARVVDRVCTTAVLSGRKLMPHSACRVH